MVPAGAGNPLAPPAQAPAQNRVVLAGGMWVLDEPIPAGDVGDEMMLPGGAAVMRDRALVSVNGEIVVLRHLPEGTNVKDWVIERRALLADDSRILPNTGDDVEVSFAEAVKEMTMEAFTSPAPISGPRTADWFLNHMRVTGIGGMIPRHHRWARESDIKSGDRSIFEHNVLSRAIDLAVRNDHLNVKNLWCLEFLIRRLQLIEEAHAENPSNPSWEGAEHFLGIEEKKGGVATAPSLKRFVADELGREAAILKEKRKAREARKQPK